MDSYWTHWRVGFEGSRSESEVMRLREEAGRRFLRAERMRGWT